MPTILNKGSYAFAEGKIKNGTVVRDQRDDWSEHQPSAGQLLATEVRAGRMKYRDIEDAAIRLRDMVDEQGR